MALAASACGKSGADADGARADQTPFDASSMSDAEIAAAQIRGDAPVTAALDAQSNRYTRLEPAVIVDSTGFEKPVGAISLFIPYGWKTEGGVYWAREFACTNGYNFIWNATSPDGFSKMGVGTQNGWAFGIGAPPSPSPGCGTQAITSVRDYVQQLVMGLHPDARILDYRPRPDLVAEVGEREEVVQMPLGKMLIWAEGGEALYAFQQDGRDMRGTFAAVIKFSNMKVESQGQPAVELVNAYAYPTYYVSAPNGELDFGFYEGLRKSMQTSSKWGAAIAGHNAAIGKVALEESRKRSDMIAQSNADIARLRQETWAAGQESADRRAREFGEALRGVETYADPNAPGGTVELSAMQSHAWRLNDGSYILSNDPNFDPWKDLQLEGRKLEAVQ